MGAGIAQLAALGGYETLLHDPQPEALERGPTACAPTSQGRRARAMDRAAEATAAWAGCARRDARRPGGCELVVEAAPEDLALKRELFGRWRRSARRRGARHQHLLAPGQRDRRRGRGPERVCGMHFFNPPALMKLVEVVAGETGRAALAAT